MFEKAGDGLPKHAHAEATAHNIMVLFGSVAVNVAGESSKIVEQGTVLDFDWAKEHYVIALEPNTVILNLLLHGTSEDYRDVSTGDLTGVYDING